MALKELGKYLKEQRERADRSLRWVERTSHALYPDEPERGISNAYLYQIEQGLETAPNPLKLKTLAQIFKVDYMYLLELAGYLKGEPGADLRSEFLRKFGALSEDQQQTVMKIIEGFLQTK